MFILIAELLLQIVSSFVSGQWDQLYMGSPVNLSHEIFILTTATCHHKRRTLQAAH